MISVRSRSWLLLDNEQKDASSVAGQTLKYAQPLYAIITGTSKDDTLLGTSQADTISGRGGNDTLRGFGGNDHLYGEDGDDVLDGGDGADVLVGGAGVDTLLGGAGDDSLTGDDRQDQLYGGAGDDWIGGTGWFYGADGNDVLQAGPGGATLDGGSGSDRLIGGDDHDTLVDYSAGDDHLSGGGGNDRLEVRGGGHDRLEGDDGDDAIFFYLQANEAGLVIVDGGAGYDTFYHYGIDGAVFRLDAEGPGHNLRNIEVVRIYEGEVTVIGGAGNDEIWGGAVMDGGAGDDFLSVRWTETGRAPDGPVVFRGGAGNDTMVGSSRTHEETADYSGAASGVTVSLQIREAQMTGDGVDTLLSIDHLIGSSFDDHLTAAWFGWGGGGSRLDGGAGDDVLVGSSGNDFLTGGAGDDLLIGGDGIDTAIFDLPRDRYAVLQTDSGFIVKGPNGVDILQGVEQLEFGEIICRGDPPEAIEGPVSAPAAVPDPEPVLAMAGPHFVRDEAWLL